MAVQNTFNSINHHRNLRDNDELIAAGILSLLSKGASMETIRWTDIAREVNIDPITVRRHMRDGQFFSKNYRRIAESFAKEISSRPTPRLFVPVFFSCVAKHRTWFGIESLQQKHHLLSEVASALYPEITANWPNYSKPDALYRIVCSEIAVTVEELLFVGFKAERLSAATSALTNLLIAVEGGRFNTSLLAYLR